MQTAAALTPDARIALAAEAVAEGRVIQKAWRKRSGGRELVCALAAFGPDINSASDCPADLMPEWLAELVPVLDAGIPAGDVPWFSAELVKHVRIARAFDAAAWERVRVAFLCACVTKALEHAERVQPQPRPAYWDQVQAACAQVLSAMRGEGDLAAAEAAAWAAAGAAWAAAEAATWAAAWAAEAAAGAAEAAAAAAAWAAEAAAWAAEAAAGAAEAAAGDAAYRALAEALFAAIVSDAGAAQ